MKRLNKFVTLSENVCLPNNCRIMFIIDFFKTNEPDKL